MYIMCKEWYCYGDWRENPFFPPFAWNDTKISWYDCRLSGASADVRLAQYETGTRKPKAELTAALAQALMFLLMPSMCLTLTAISVWCTLYLLWKIYTVWLSAKQMMQSVWKSILPKEKKLTNCWNCCIYGKSRLTSYLPVKSARTNTITGVITIRSSIPHNDGRKCHHRS